MVASNKERLESLETSLRDVQDKLQMMQVGMAKKFYHIETSLNRLLESMASGNEGRRDQSNNRGNASNGTVQNQETFHSNKFEETKLEFPRFSRGDPTSWLSKTRQFFVYYDMPDDDQRVQYATYHLEEEAYVWWQVLKKSYDEKNIVVTWGILEEEMLARFGPITDGHEALSEIEQTGSLREYVCEFERLQNRVKGWTQKALIGTFVGGLHPEICDEIRMFRPQSLYGYHRVGQDAGSAVSARTRKSMLWDLISRMHEFSVIPVLHIMNVLRIKQSS